MSAPFKPSQVEIQSSPLLATMGRAETESAAALLVYACAQNGDQWQAVTIGQVIEAVRAAGPDSTIGGIVRNPFLKPDFIGLVAGAFATRTDGQDVSFELTAKALAALQRWVLPEEEASRG